MDSAEAIEMAGKLRNEEVIADFDFDAFLLDAMQRFVAGQPMSTSDIHVVRGTVW